MRKKINYYIRSVRGEEVLLVIILVLGLIVTYGNVLNNNFAKIGASVFDSILNENSYRKAMIYYDSRKLSEDIYKETNNLKDVNFIIRNKYFYYGNMNYALIDKNTGEIISNDDLLKQYVSSKMKIDPNIEKQLVEDYINQQGYSAVLVDNINSFNYYVTYDELIRNKEMSNYIEVYYSYPTNYDYVLKTDSITAKLIIGTTIFTGILIIKILINIMINYKNVSWDIKTLKKLVCVLKYGFKYKYTRNKMVISMISSAAIIIVYLYLVAGIRTENVLLTFLERYPFKGTLVIILIPLLSILYSLKKTLDISIINEGLRKINEGNFEYILYQSSENEIKELVDSINQIKEGYRIAVDDKLRNERLKTELISNASHDLKTPLTSIINYVNILKSKNITEEEREEYLEIVEKKAFKLKVLIEDLFEISKLNSGKMILNKDEIDIVSLIHQGIGEYSTLYEEKNIIFKVNSNKEEIVMNLDGKLMSSLFENIIINALKYSLANTRVYIDILDEGELLKILFRNIANYEMDFDTEEIFEKFVRGDKSRNSEIEGSGMGLAISKSILELHNGDMKIDIDGDMFKLIILLPKYNNILKEKISFK